MVILRAIYEYEKMFKKDKICDLIASLNSIGLCPIMAKKGAVVNSPEGT